MHQKWNKLCIPWMNGNTVFWRNFQAFFTEENNWICNQILSCFIVFNTIIPSFWLWIKQFLLKNFKVFKKILYFFNSKKYFIFSYFSWTGVKKQIPVSVKCRLSFRAAVMARLVISTPTHPFYIDYQKVFMSELKYEKHISYFTYRFVILFLVT